MNNPETTPLTQTFRAADPRAALAAVRAALGDDAVIVGTREVPGGLWSRREIEITASVAAAEERAPDSEQKLRAEIGSLRRVIEELRTRLPDAAIVPRPSPIDAELPPIYRQLVARGVEPVLAERIIREALRRNPSAADFADVVRTIVGQQLPVAVPPWAEPERSVLALVGPTGVGKTTTIAKIAARAILETRRRVALITVDNYRIGAREHLARYGEIMHLPLQLAHDRETLRAALRRAADADLVLIDTAGRSDADTIAAQGALLASAPEVRIAVTLSAAAGARELRAAARRFQGLSPHRIIFTKLDESDGPGGILTAALAAHRPIACFADGQRVPDDLHAATTAALCDVVAGNRARGQ